MKRIAGTRIKRLVPVPELKGDKHIYFIKEQYEDMYYCSPAIYSLLEDESLKKQLMKDLQVVDVQTMVKEEYEDLIAKLVQSNKPKRKRAKKTDID